MTNPVLVDDELTRLEILHSLDLLDTPSEVEFDELVQLAAAVCDTPISLVTLVDKDRQWFKASFGLAATETHRSLSFCAHAIQQSGLFLVEDASSDPRFAGNPFVLNAPALRFYAGMPLLSPDGYAMGTLCVVDTKPRRLTTVQQNALEVLSRQVSMRMYARRQQRQLQAALQEKEAIAVGLRASEERFRAFMNSSPFLSYMKDSDGRMLYYNQRFADQFNVSPTEWLGRNDRELWPQHMADQFRQHDLAVLEGGVLVELAEVSPAANGGITHWKSYKFPCDDQNGNQLLCGVSVDVTNDLNREQVLASTLQQKTALARSLQASEMLFRTFMDHCPHLAFLKSADGRYVFYNRLCAEHFGIDATAWIGRTDHEVLPQSIADYFRQSDLQALASDQPLELLDHLTDAAGKHRTFKAIKFNYTNSRGEKMLAGIAVDVTEALEHKAQMELANIQLSELAAIDPLTGLHNRRIFQQRLELEFSLAQRSKRRLSVVMIDVDNFKSHNDRWGHPSGDAVLQKLAQVLNSTIRLTDTAARYGGEEFALLLPDTDGKNALELAERIKVNLRAADWQHETVTMSVGVATLTSATSNCAELVEQADKMLYAAKRAGKDRILSDRLQSDHWKIPSNANITT